MQQLEKEDYKYFNKFKLIFTYEFQHWKKNQSIKYINSYYGFIQIINILIFIIIAVYNIHIVSTQFIKYIVTISLIAVNTLLVLIYVIIKLKIQNFKEFNIPLQLLIFFQFSTITFNIFYLDEDNRLIVLIFLLLYQEFQPHYLDKIIALIIITLQTFILGEKQYQQIIELILIIVNIIIQEYNLFKQYQQAKSFYTILQNVPQAFCIVNKKSKEIEFTNSNFQTFLDLFCPLNQETDKKIEKIQADFLRDLNYHSQIKFLNNLLLKEITQKEKVLIENQFISELIAEKEGKITNIDFNQGTEFHQSGSHFIQLALTNINQNSVLNEGTMNQQDITKTTYMTEFQIQIDINYDAPSYILQHNQSNSLLHQDSQINKYFKNQQRRSDGFINNRGYSQISRLNFSQQDNIQDSRKNERSQINLENISNPVQKLDKKLSINNQVSLLNKSGISSPQQKKSLNQYQKYLINKLDQLILNDQEVELYFIQNLSQLMTYSKFKEFSKIRKNFQRSLQHELVTYLNGAYSHLEEAINIVKNKKNQHLKEDQLKQLEQLINIGLCYIQLQLFKVNDFQDFCTVTDDGNDFNIQIKEEEKLSLKTAIQDCLSLSEESIKQKKLRLVANFDTNEDYIILTDQQRLKQVFLNLLSNAVRFTFEGEIQKKTDKLRQALRTQEQVQQKRNNKYSPKKYGIEQIILLNKLISNDDSNKVSKDSVGIGIGLIVTKEILKVIGAMDKNLLYFESQPKFGNLLELRINQDSVVSQDDFFNEDHLVDQRIKFLNSQRSPLTKSFRKETFIISSPRFNGTIFTNFQGCNCNSALIVDDEQFNLNALSLILKNKIESIDQALNGQQAIESFMKRVSRKCSPTCKLYSLILLDLNMPIKNGWETASEIRQIEKDLELSRQNIIAITAFTDQKAIDKCFQEGFDKIMQKPATKKKIDELLHEYRLLIG